MPVKFQIEIAKDDKKLNFSLGGFFLAHPAYIIRVAQKNFLSHIFEAFCFFVAFGFKTAQKKFHEYTTSFSTAPQH